MIVRAAVCPHPPLLIPEIAQRSAPELDALREACLRVVRGLTRACPERIVVLGAGPQCQTAQCQTAQCQSPQCQTWDATAGGTFAPYGVDVHAGGGSDELPLSLSVGAWLLDRAGWEGPRIYTSLTSYEMRPMGHIPYDVRAAVLVMADGSAKRSAEAPGYFDERASGFDDSIAVALKDGDAAALCALDQPLAAELWASGVPPISRLAEMSLAETTKGATIAAQLHYDDAPFGVGYWVADWEIC